ncbi:hypothetical protein BJX66DRAFT_320771 [Aspergillus keveii]|uniref:Cyanovirin-N domain-containing protein n=1 Tax=Aspergillus keveii TaxID=714993 RepID=A0ABR4FGP0_9EURO
MKSILLVIHALFIALSTAGDFNQTCKNLDIDNTMIKARCLMDNHELSEIEVQIDLNKCGPCADRGEMCSDCFDMGQEGKVQCLLAGTEKFYMKPNEYISNWNGNLHCEYLAGLPLPTPRKQTD